MTDKNAIIFANERAEKKLILLIVWRQRDNTVFNKAEELDEIIIFGL